MGGGHMKQISVRAGGSDPGRQGALVHIGGPPRILADDDPCFFLRMLPAVIPAEETAGAESMVGGQIYAGFAAKTVGPEVFAHRNRSFFEWDHTEKIHGAFYSHPFGASSFFWREDQIGRDPSSDMSCKTPPAAL